jgi:hypothetical protein
MGLCDMILQACGVAACFLVAFGLVRLGRALRMNRLRRIDADYRAAALVINTRRALRAGQHRAAEREWGRAA